MKTKWLKAIKSLKSASSISIERRNGANIAQPLGQNEEGKHSLQEYTYKKITPCDVCSQILRGHTRQGLRCRICKINSHASCSAELPKCQVKQKLLRRQKSTYDIENRAGGEEEATPTKEMSYELNNSGQEMVDLAEDVAKLVSSCSTSGCPSPEIPLENTCRQLPTKFYIALYNFNARHKDELDLKAGYQVGVLDSSDVDWWKGKCGNRVGYFPSKYCTKLNPGEKPLQVTDNIKVAESNRSQNMHLLRDQIVMQIGEEFDGVIRIRAANNRQGVCPVKYLQHV